MVPWLSRRPLLVVVLMSVATITASVAVAQRASTGKSAKRPVHVPKQSPESVARLLHDADANSRLQAPTYRGLTVAPHPLARGQVLQLHKRIADVMATNDFVPHERMRRFSWYEDAHPAKIIGWKAAILDAEPTPAGVLVKTKVEFIGSMKTLYTDDHMIEYYMFRDGRLDYLKSEEPISAPNISVF